MKYFGTTNLILYYKLGFSHLTSDPELKFNFLKTSYVYQVKMVYLLYLNYLFQLI